MSTFNALVLAFGALLVIGAALAALVVYSACACRTLTRRTVRLQELVTTQERSIGQLESAITALMRHVTATQDRIDRFTEQSLALKSNVAAQTAFEEASRLLREGHTADALVDTCGLNGLEADLMARVHTSGSGTPPDDSPRDGRVSVATTPFSEFVAATDSHVATREEARLRQVLSGT